MFEKSIGIFDQVAATPATLTDDALDADLLSFQVGPDAVVDASLSNSSLGTFYRIASPLFDRDAVSGLVRLISPSDELDAHISDNDDPSPRAYIQKALSTERKSKKPQTAGPQWFDMPAVELTDDLKRDLKLLQMRNVLDPKRFYKKDKSLFDPKSGNTRFLQVGTIMDSALEPASHRLTKKQRKNRIVDELLAEEEERLYFKRRYTDIQKKKMENMMKQRRPGGKLGKKSRK